MDKQNSAPNVPENIGSLELEGFKVIERDQAIRIQDLSVPLIGRYRGKERAKHSDLYLIDTENGIVKVLGNTDLDSRMAKVVVGTIVAVIYEGEFITQKGNRMFRCTVMVKHSS
ncbi:MAG: hypothetical protein AB7O96_10030 [Pseudobdellovibrionaceae bacterium]